ncbi:MAG: phenylacetate--CoA ligase family protein [Clostridia bacterium]|nr:phenylacetate--CoA ligase family protein [Clostridia bacterium]
MDLYRGIMKTAVNVKRVLTGSGAQAEYTAYLEKIQYLPPGELKSLQAACICGLLKHAVENIPFYTQMKGKVGLTPESAFEDIKKFPILTKAMLIEKNNELAAGNIVPAGRLNTGGTTGETASVLKDKYSMAHAPDEFFNRKIGIEPGRSRLILKADERKKAANEIGGFDYEINRISRTWRVDHRYMNDARLKFLTDILIKQKPEIIWGSNHGIYVLAKHLEDKGITVRPPSTILCGGQMMLPQYREKIECVFRAKVYDRYGSVECGNTANQCEAREGYHYVPTVHYIEILDDSMNPVGGGVMGNLYITTLNRRAMPMIRYETGDLAVYTETPCACGCRFPVIGEIHGRRKEGIISPRGTYLSLTPLNTIMRQSPEILDFQMVQESRGSLLIRLATGDNMPGEAALAKIKSDICAAMDYNMDIRFEYAEAIRALPNGKVMRVVPLERLKELGDY